MNTPLCDRSLKRLVPDERGMKVLSSNEVSKLLSHLKSGWNVVDQKVLIKEYRFDNFREVLGFTNIIGELAERENHHPHLLLSQTKVQLKIFTHAIDGLSENDFVLAAKCDEEFAEYHPTRACF